MKGVSWFTVVLVAVIAALVSALVATNFGGKAALAQGGGGAAAGDVIAVTSEFSPGRGLLYLVDTKKEVLLVYSFHRAGTGAGSGSLTTGELELLAGRHFKWDTLAVERSEFFGRNRGATPNDMRKRFEEIQKRVGRGEPE